MVRILLEMSNFGILFGRNDTQVKLCLANVMREGEDLFTGALLWIRIGGKRG